MDQLQLHIPFNEEFYNICLDPGDNLLFTVIKDLHWENGLAEILGECEDIHGMLYV